MNFYDTIYLSYYKYFYLLAKPFVRMGRKVTGLNLFKMAELHIIFIACITALKALQTLHFLNMSEAVSFNILREKHQQYQKYPTVFSSFNYIYYV